MMDGGVGYPLYDVTVQRAEPGGEGVAAAGGEPAPRRHDELGRQLRPDRHRLGPPRPPDHAPDPRRRRRRLPPAEDPPAHAPARRAEDLGGPPQEADRVRLGRARHRLPAPAHRRDGADAVRRLRLPRPLHRAGRPGGELHLVRLGQAGLHRGGAGGRPRRPEGHARPPLHGELPAVQHHAGRRRLVRRLRRRSWPMPGWPPAWPAGEVPRPALRHRAVPGQALRLPRRSATRRPSRGTSTPPRPGGGAAR